MFTISIGINWSLLWHTDVLWILLYSAIIN